jgi:threonine synthase
MAILRCINCQTEFPASTLIYTCSNCDGLIDVIYDLDSFRGETLTDHWDQRRGSSNIIDRSGVWRFRELLPDADLSEIVTMIEGNTQVFDAPRSAAYAGMDRLSFKHLGMNPTGSFKDLGMTTGITQARRMGAKSVACASTGNTSASLAAYAARAGMKAYVFIPAGQVSLGKLSQALDYGATLLQIEGDFDDAMRLVREAANDSPIYLLNSVNPFRLEGQKTIAFELLQQCGWRTPDRVVVPGGNLGNSSAIAKGFHELLELGVIEKMPKLTIVQAEGANPLYRLWLKRDPDAKMEPVDGAFTLATAIKIGSPVSWPKALRALRWSDGSVEQVSEQEIADAKSVIGRDGIGCEPASAVTLAGIKKLALAGAIKPDEDIVAILTGHLLKDPDYTVRYHAQGGGSLGYTDKNGETVAIESHFANPIVRLPADRAAIGNALGALGKE